MAIYVQMHLIWHYICKMDSILGANLEAATKLSCGELKDSGDAILASSGQVLAIWGHSHGIQPLVGHIQGRGWASLGVG